VKNEKFSLIKANSYVGRIWSKETLHAMHSGCFKKEYQQLDKNLTEVIRASLAIENKIKTIIFTYLFKRDSKESTFFVNEILEKEFFSFSAKIKVFLSIVKMLSLYEIGCF